MYIYVVKMEIDKVCLWELDRLLFVLNLSLNDCNGTVTATLLISKSQGDVFIDSGPRLLALTPS